MRGFATMKIHLGFVMIPCGSYDWLRQVMRGSASFEVRFGFSYLNVCGYDFTSLPQRGKGDHEVVDEVFAARRFHFKKE